MVIFISLAVSRVHFYSMKTQKVVYETFEESVTRLLDASNLCFYHYVKFKLCKHISQYKREAKMERDILICFARM